MTRPDPCHLLATCGSIIQMQAAHAGSTTSTSQLYRRCLLTASRLRGQSHPLAEQFPHQSSCSGGTPQLSTRAKESVPLRREPHAPPSPLHHHSQRQSRHSRWHDPKPTVRGPCDKIPCCQTSDKERKSR